MCRLSRNLGVLTSWNPLGLFRPVMGQLYLLRNEMAALVLSNFCLAFLKFLIIFAWRFFYHLCLKFLIIFTWSFWSSLPEVFDHLCLKFLIIFTWSFFHLCLKFLIMFTWSFPSSLLEVFDHLFFSSIDYFQVMCIWLVQSTDYVYLEIVRYREP